MSTLVDDCHVWPLEQSHRSFTSFCHSLWILTFLSLMMSRFLNFPGSITALLHLTKIYVVQSKIYNSDQVTHCLFPTSPAHSRARVSGGTPTPAPWKVGTGGLCLDMECLPYFLSQASLLWVWGWVWPQGRWGPWWWPLPGGRCCFFG